MSLVKNGLEITANVFSSCIITYSVQIMFYLLWWNSMSLWIQFVLLLVLSPLIWFMLAFWGNLNLFSQCTERKDGPHHRQRADHGAPGSSCSTCTFSHRRHMCSGRSLQPDKQHTLCNTQTQKSEKHTQSNTHTHTGNKQQIADGARTDV